MRKIAASILGKENKKDLINMLIKKGIDSIHYDVMDGEFVDNFSLPINEVIELFQTTNAHYKDVHLMVNNPSVYLDKLINLADQVSVHVESKELKNIDSFVEKYHKKVNLGLVVNPDTEITKIFNVLDKLNHIMIMSVYPGKGGQKFIEDTFSKIELIKNEVKKKKLKLIIEIDGGINDFWGPKVFEAGINIAVSGSYLINNIDHGSIDKILGKK